MSEYRGIFSPPDGPVPAIHFCMYCGEKDTQRVMGDGDMIHVACICGAHSPFCSAEADAIHMWNGFARTSALGLACIGCPWELPDPGVDGDQ